MAGKDKDKQQAALFAAAEAGDLPAFQEACSNVEGDAAKLRNAQGASLLHVAALAGRTELCSHLLDKLGLDVNVQDSAGSTALAAAASGGHADTAEALLDRGADVNCCGSGEAAAAPLHLAVAGEQLELARRLIAAGADVDAPSGHGTPLMLAAARSNLPLVEALLGAGADVKAAGRQGLTPLFMALAVGASAECVAALLKAGADPNGRAFGGFTPLHVAAEGGRQAAAEALLQAGADPEARDEHGHTPARVAAMHGHRSLVEALLRRGGGGGGAAAAAAAAGEGPSSSAVDEFIAGSKEDLKAREAKANSSGAAGSASVVRIPEPECPDEALSDTFKRKGNEMFVAGEYETAAKLYELALSHWTKNPVVWSNRAACFLRLDRFEKALQDAQVARTLDPKYVKAWYREGRAAEGLKRWEDAATAYYQAAQLQPDNEEFVRLTKEAILEGRKEYQAAQQAEQQQGQGPAASGSKEN